MAKDWDYANLAHTAKEFGGPEKYLQIVKDHSFQEGRKEQLIINGAIVAQAKLYNVPVPYNSLIVDLIHAIEGSYKYQAKKS